MQRFECTIAIILLLIVNLSLAAITRKLETVIGSKDKSIPVHYNSVLPTQFSFDPQDETIIYYIPKYNTHILLQLNLTSGEETPVFPQGFQFLSSYVFIIDPKTSEIIYSTSNVVTRYNMEKKSFKTIAGGGSLKGDYVPAINCQLESVASLAIDPVNGDLYIGQPHTVKRVRNRIITTVAGGGTKRFEYSGPVANPRDYKLQYIGPMHAYDNTLHFYEFQEYTLFKISKDGSMVNVLGNGDSSPIQDNTVASNSPAFLAFFSVNDITGEIFFGYKNTLAKIDNNGIIRVMSNITDDSLGISDVYYSTSPDEGVNSLTLSLVPEWLTISPKSKELVFSEPKGRFVKIVNSDSSNSLQWKISTIYGSKGYTIDGIPAAYVKSDYILSVMYKQDSNEWYFNSNFLRKLYKTNPNSPLIVQTLSKAETSYHYTYSKQENVFYYVQDNYLYKLDIRTMAKTIVAGNGQKCVPQDGAPQLQTCVCQIGDLEVSPFNGQVYLLMNLESRAGHSILYTLQNGILRIIAGMGDDVYSSNIPANITSIGYGSTFAIGLNNDIYIADLQNQIVKAIYSNGFAAVVAGSKGATDYGEDGIKATDASVAPITVLVLPQGDFLFTEDNRIRKVSKQTGLINTIYGDFDAGYTQDGEIQTNETLFNYPMLKGYIEDKNQLILVDQVGSSYLRTELRFLETKCDLGEYLEPDWKHCLKCPDGKYSSSDFTGCDGQIVYCNGIPFDSPNVCSKHGKCTLQSSCQCEQNWYGNDCSQTTCNGVSSSVASVCGGNGQCVDYNQCKCRDGYFGQFCQFISIPQEAFKTYFNTTTIRIGTDYVSVVMTSNFNLISKSVVEFLNDKSLKISLSVQSEISKTNVDSREITSIGIPIYSIFDLGLMKTLDHPDNLKAIIKISLERNEISSVESKNNLLAGSASSLAISFTFVILTLLFTLLQ